jgi:hypothetical protein
MGRHTHVCVVLLYHAYHHEVTGYVSCKRQYPLISKTIIKSLCGGEWEYLLRLLPFPSLYTKFA